MSSDIPAGVKVEPIFLVEARYTPEAAERRPAVRPEHLARMARLRDEGTIIEAGAYSDRMSSSILLVQAEDAAAALAIARADVYVKAGVWGDISARPFGRVVSEADQAARSSAGSTGG
jgi:uncharacterized protein YciI